MLPLEVQRAFLAEVAKNWADVEHPGTVVRALAFRRIATELANHCPGGRAALDRLMAAWKNEKKVTTLGRALEMLWMRQSFHARDWFRRYGFFLVLIFLFYFPLNIFLIKKINLKFNFYRQKAL
jgi:hypothetical protein